MINLKKFCLGLALATLAAIPASVGADDPAPAPSGGGVKAEILAMIDDANDKLEQLAAKTPPAKYSWRPAKGVRSTGEIFMHVAAANFGVPSFWGVVPPQGFNFETFEKSLTKKDDIERALKNSFEYMEKGLKNTSDADLDKPVDLFGNKTTVRGAYILLTSHAHEHLGQSIAYARMNGIVPPWTAKQEEAAKEVAKKKEEKKDAYK
jgi:uncharacterized damage-inducible protein DinB